MDWLLTDKKGRLARWCAILSSVLAGIVFANAQSVGKVTAPNTPELSALARSARQIGDEVYPKVLALSQDGQTKLPARFDIVFKPTLHKALGRAQRGLFGYTVYLAGDYFTKNPTNLEPILVHEMAHVAQGYTLWTGAPSYWREGMADYVRFKLGYTNAQYCARCDLVSNPHYTYGYSCLGAFLLHLDATRGSNVVRGINAEIRRRAFSGNYFVKTTGRTLGELWAEFQQTPAFVPGAAEINRVRALLGYRDGKPPRDFRRRLEAYVRGQGGAEKTFRALGYVKGKPAGDLRRQFEFYLAAQQRAGGKLAYEAGEFLWQLKESKRLPGWQPGENGSMSLEWKPNNTAVSYPATVSLKSVKDSQPRVTYHFDLVQPAQDAEWQLARAWRTAADGKLLEEYGLPRP